MISKNHGPCLILPSSGQKRMPFSQVMSRKNPWQVDVDETHSLDFKVWLEPMVWVASHPIWPRRNMGCWMDMKCGHLMGICGNWPQISQHISQISRIPPHSLNATKTAALWLSFRRSFETLAQTMATKDPWLARIFHRQMKRHGLPIRCPGDAAIFSPECPSPPNGTVNSHGSGKMGQNAHSLRNQVE